ncbi:ferredoxin reductase [Aliidongia dinghuensis]|uniref:Ferredoxin reductase n=1 Tax=Aliidongia dinghuensis TaxID=1867774 RepID=A0A8J2YPB8_9PROT|nr:FAD-dependent oxidoreductase [Aliidongia dinghuensis]GGE98973.1 ferredoxin reductase [Aliidongia dinghuensis]
MSRGAVIVGAGQAGGRAAMLLAERGYPGPVMLIGAEPLPPYERPPLSKDMLADPAAAPAFLAAADEYERLGVRMMLGRRVVSIDRAARRVVLDDGTTVPYRQLVLATGGRPRHLPFQLQRLQTLRTVDDVHAIAAQAAGARSVLVIGGGVIGLEVAATLRIKGLAVTVVEIGSRLLGRNFPHPVAALIAERHRARGVDIRTGLRVRTMWEDAAGVHATLSNDETITADFAVAGIGIVPDTGLAQDAGLIVDDGVVVDEAMRSSDPAIFAIGDMAAQAGADGRFARYETWQNANVTAERAAAAILGEALPPRDAPWFWTDQFDLNVQLAGRTGPEVEGARIVEQGSTVAGGRVFLLIEGRRLAGVAAVNAGRDMSVCRRLVAAEVELPDGFVAAEVFDARAARALLGSSRVGGSRVSGPQANASQASAHPVDA